MKIYFLTDSIELSENIQLKLSNKDIILFEKLTKQKASFFIWKTIVDKNWETHSWIIDFLETKWIKLTFPRIKWER